MLFILILICELYRLLSVCAPIILKQTNSNLLDTGKFLRHRIASVPFVSFFAPNSDISEIVTFYLNNNIWMNRLRHFHVCYAMRISILKFRRSKSQTTMHICCVMNDAHFDQYLKYYKKDLCLKTCCRIAALIRWGSY